MTCERCVSRVADALNALGGTWSDVDLASGRAHVRSKSELDAGALLAAVRDAGYEASLA